ncbi:MAG: protein kinase [Myxococcota bacterium]|nr:protein kinase [Myxococcota bacterium]
MTLEPRELRLVRPLDSGDLATVFAAVDLSHGNVSRAVALLHPDLDDLDAIIARIEERIIAARGIDHPGHVRAEGIYEVSGRPGVVMQLVEGKDLERIAKRKAVPGPVAARIMGAVVDVLEAAAEANLVHGHLGPSRIIVTGQGTVRVLGLGMRKGADPGPSNPLYREDRSVHRYAPPEGLSGLVTSAVDVYAVGSILTRVISGRWPKRSSSNRSSQQTVVEGAAHVVNGAGASEELVGLVRDCLGFRADLRPFLAELRTNLAAASIDDDGWRQWLREHVQSATDSSELVEESVDEQPSGPNAVVEAEAGAEGAPPSPPAATPGPADLDAGDAEAPEVDRADGDAIDDVAPDDGVLEDTEAAATEIDSGASNTMESDRGAGPLDDDGPNEPPADDAAASEEPSFAAAEAEPAPPTLGALPPPTTRSSVGPLAVTGGEDLDTECTDDPDTVDEPTEEAPKPGTAPEVDASADKWDRMLGLDLKVQNEVDQEWLRAARGSSFNGKRLAIAAALVGLVAVGVRMTGGSTPPDPTVESSAGSDVVKPVESVEPVAPTESAPPAEPVSPAESAPPAEPEPTMDAPPVSEVRAVPEPPEPPPPAEPEPNPPAPQSVPVEPPPADAPEPPTVDELPPTGGPAATPDAEPQPSEPVPVEAPPPPATAVVRVTGDAHDVRLVRDATEFMGGRIPPGSYTIMVEFQPGDALREQGTLSIAAGESAVINCKSAFYRCSTRGPWK